MKTDVGVIVGRFQVPNLHESHILLIEKIRELHKKVIIFLGISPVCDQRNPMDVFTRQKMIAAMFPDVLVAYIQDHRYDTEWSKELDHQIKGLAGTSSVTLYGGRDSFLPRYSGIFFKKSIEEIVPNLPPVSGSELRSIVAKESLGTEDFRKGVIYSVCAKPSMIRQYVMPICFKKDKVLMYREHAESPLQFLGDFPSPEDESLEKTARRVIMEKVDGEPSRMVYNKSIRIKDWRYGNMIVILFLTELCFGSIASSKYVEWVCRQDLALLRPMMHDHLPIIYEIPLSYKG